MKFRATEKDIYDAVKVDTKKLLKSLNWEPKQTDGELDIGVVSNSLRKAIEHKQCVFAADKEEVKDALAIAETQEDYILCVQHWMGRLLQYKDLGFHVYGSETHQWVLEIGIQGASLWVKLESKRIDKELFMPYKLKLKLTGKPSRVLTKLFGEELVTYMCQHHPIKPACLTLQLSRVYIPELYMMMAKGENHTSCMSKTHDEYGLEDDAHPTLAYENSSNACLALLYSETKGRHVARAICKIEAGRLNFSSGYGLGGCGLVFQELGLDDDSDMEGMKLSKIYTKTCMGRDDELLVPYVDGDTQCLEDRGCCLVVDGSGSVEGSYETGRAICGHMCEHCDERVDEELTYADNGRNVCESCLDAAYIYVDDVLYHCEDTCYCASEDVYILNDDVVYCEYSEEHYRDNEEMVEVRREGQRYSTTIALRNLVDCMENWSIEEIDGQDANDYLGIEEEQEEQAA